MGVLKTVLLLPIRLLILAIQLLLTIALGLLSAAGGCIKLVAGLVGMFIMLVSLLCAATRQVDGAMFLQMFLFGAAIEAIPIIIVTFGENGIIGLKRILYKL